ncbi:MAG: CMP-N,N'-diacetyllegionaminic acid synthase [Cyclobacteriaceae bacterium]|jgi:CMP-N,N'-diacetyllegionaminic acid synthase
MRVLGLIPARGGSKGIPGKNIKQLNGIPLIGYTIKSALASIELANVIVSTEDDQIAEIANALGVETPFIRPQSLASDESPTIDTVIHALESMEKLGQSFDAVCLLQPTVPFRNEGSIDAAIQKFIKAGSESLISVRKVPHIYNPHWTFVESDDKGFLEIATGDQKIVTRRQALPTAYHRDGSIYITSTDIIRSKKSLYGEKITFLQNDEAVDINIDEESDWEKAVQYIRYER